MADAGRGVRPAGGWGAYGIRSCAHWLAWQCGMSPGTAREHVRVARALVNLPQVSAAFAAGRLSYSEVRALTRVAEPATEAELLTFALEATASQTERVVRQWRRADAAHRERVTARRQFEYWWDDDGMLTVHLRLDAEEGARFLAGVDSLAERAARRDRARVERAASTGGSAGGARGPAELSGAAEGIGTRIDTCSPGRGDTADEVALARERTTARRCAALAHLADAAAEADRRAGDPPRREVVVHADVAVLADDSAAGRAYLDGGPALHPADVRRMLCEATVVSMLAAGREPLALGRARRLATRTQRRALHRRDGGCARPGCPETRIERLHAHHMRHWLFGGATDVANMVLLCDSDHGLVHDLDLVMSRRDGRLVVTAPDGRRVWGAADDAFTGGVSSVAAAAPSHPEGLTDRFVGVHPIDQQVGRRPGAAPPFDGPDGPGPVRGVPTGRSAGVEPGPVSAERSVAPTAGGAATVTDLLFPGGAPGLPDAMDVNGERIDLAYVVSVLMGHRDFVRRLAAEAA
ncbi:DUF222 domain-containing protein [Geodermatophilus sp. SYSU D01105]